MQICLIIITGCSFKDESLSQVAHPEQMMRKDDPSLDHQWPKTLQHRFQARPTIPGSKRHAMASTDLTVFSYNLGLSDVSQFKEEELISDLKYAKRSRLSTHQP
jgi:hypothetical protein